MLEGYTKVNDTVNIGREQRRLHVVALRAAAESSHDIEIVAAFNFRAGEGQRKELLAMCAGAMDKTLWEMAKLTSSIEESF